MKNTYLLSLKLRGFDAHRLKSGETQIQQLYTSISPKNTPHNVHDVVIVSLPEQRSHITVLRSPHIDKKSREQFVFKKNQKLIQYKFKNQKALNLFLLGLKCLECTGIEIVIQLRSRNYYTETI